MTIEEKYYTLSLVIKNSLGDKTIVSLESLLDGYLKGKFYTLKESKSYESRFGKKNWFKILDGLVVVGFTEEMVLLSWGDPEDINKASYGEQWIYDGQYLYFKNGKLTSFN